MRERTSNGGVTVQAIAGNHAVFLGFDLDDAAQPGCMGFAIEREDRTENEKYFLSSFKTFKSVVPNPDPTKHYSTEDHPIQSFYWGDYSAKPAHDYTYRVVPRYGTPGNLAENPGVEASVSVSTSDPTKGTHGIYFNRGVAASQAYANKFGDPASNPPDRNPGALVWLSRGLMEAILAFIGQASGPGFALRAAVYEFSQADVLAAFQTAHKTNKADVQIVYHAKDDSEGNTNKRAIADAGVDPEILIERTNTNIAHNKFIVFCTKDAAGNLTPVSVWTGSTNLSEGGIYGHSNVGHAVRDSEVAAQYLAFWEQLKDDPTEDALRDWMTTGSPFDAAAPPVEVGIHTLFSPRHGLAPLSWYADRFGVGPSAAAHITLPFGMSSGFETQLKAYTGTALHYAMLDKADDHQAEWSKDVRVLVAVGSRGGPDELRTWAKESLTGFNPMVPYLHTKILLVDPLRDSPTVISGSANWSSNSTSNNDENMLVIQGDEQVADVYFTEYARIFNHFYARYWASQLSKGPDDAETHSFLDETEAWRAPYFADGNPKSFQRVLYSSQVEGNQ